MGFFQLRHIGPENTTSTHDTQHDHSSHVKCFLSPPQLSQIARRIQDNMSPDVTNVCKARPKINKYFFCPTTFSIRIDGERVWRCTSVLPSYGLIYRPMSQCGYKMLTESFSTQNVRNLKTMTTSAMHIASSKRRDVTNAHQILVFQFPPNVTNIAVTIARTIYCQADTGHWTEANRGFAVHLHSFTKYYFSRKMEKSNEIFR